MNLSTVCCGMAPAGGMASTSFAIANGAAISAPAPVTPEETAPKVAARRRLCWPCLIVLFLICWRLSYLTRER